MANTKISALTANTNPNWSEEFVYAYNNANWKITLNTMKSFVGWAWVTTLTADANIWELSGGFYETTHNLYYKSWEALPHLTGSWASFKYMIFVTDDWTSKAYFVYGVDDRNHSTIASRAFFWTSTSSSVGGMKELGKWDAALEQYKRAVSSWSSSIDPLRKDNLTQDIANISGSETIELSTTETPYEWLTYTIIVKSVASGQDYTVTLGTWVTNPLGLTLPTSSTKPCVITVVPTSTTTAVITGCTIGN